MGFRVGLVDGISGHSPSSGDPAWQLRGIPSGAGRVSSADGCSSLSYWVTGEQHLPIEP